MCVTILRAYLKTIFIVVPCFKPLNVWGGKQSVNLITAKSCDSALLCRLNPENIF